MVGLALGLEDGKFDGINEKSIEPVISSDSKVETVFLSPGKPPVYTVIAIPVATNTTDIRKVKNDVIIDTFK